MNATETEFRFDDWLSEGVRALKSKRHRLMKSLMPKEFGRHMRAARKEMLLAFRSLIDEAIERMEQAEAENQTRATTIKVE